MWGDWWSRRCKNGRGSGGRAGREAEWRLSSENIRMGTALGGYRVHEPLNCALYKTYPGEGKRKGG